MRRVSCNQLIPGRQYRVKHIEGVLPTSLGTFIQNHFDIHSEFNKIIGSHGTREQPLTRSTYSANEWQYFESAESLIAEQVARGLSDRIPEDTAGLIERFLIPKAKLTTDRYQCRLLFK